MNVCRCSIARPLRDFGGANVRFGSEADVATDRLSVRFTPESGNRDFIK